jgi:hypothetical protein
MMHFSFRNRGAGRRFSYQTLHNLADANAPLISRATKPPVFKPEITQFHAKGWGSTIAVKFG